MWIRADPTQNSAQRLLVLIDSLRQVLVLAVVRSRSRTESIILGCTVVQTFKSALAPAFFTKICNNMKKEVGLILTALNLAFSAHN